MFWKSCVLDVLLSKKIVLEICQECKVMLGSVVVSLKSMCQTEEALLHYPLIGSTVTPFFPVLMGEVNKVPEWVISDGFSIFYGLCGLKYNFWQAVKTTALVLSYKAVLSNVTSRGQQDDRKIHYTIVTKWTFIKINTVILDSPIPPKVRLSLEILEDKLFLPSNNS
jgi:hypothetical protein